MLALSAVIGTCTIVRTGGRFASASKVLALIADSAFFSIVITIVSGVMIVSFVGKIKKRLTDYTSSIKDMSDGKIGEKLEITGNDEISKLGKAFNDMSEKYSIIEAQRTEFVSNASHELKTPLSSIKLMADSRPRR